MLVEAKELLKEACKDKEGLIVKEIVLDARLSVITNGREFVDTEDPRSAALWVQVLKYLINKEFVEDWVGEGRIYHVTHMGYTHLKRFLDL